MLDPVTAPIPGLMLRLVAPLTLHDSRLDPPGLMLAGLAVKLRMTGGLPAGGLTTMGR
jgi:hypothetical protein